jgi:tripartite-type tricarboxylate transporter receptor subunit TctC
VAEDLTLGKVWPSRKSILESGRHSELVATEKAGQAASLALSDAPKLEYPRWGQRRAVQLSRRQVLRLATGAAALPALARVAGAVDYPGRPVRIVVGFAAGGPSDIITRLIGQWLAGQLGQQFIVESRPGAGGTIATESVAHALPDGYTLLQIDSSGAINAGLYDNLNFNLIRDIAPIAGISRSPDIMVVNPAFVAESVSEFIAYAKANPGKINMASGGTGTTAHMAGELFKLMADVDMLHVPYRGGALALTDLMAGQVQVMFSPAVGAIEHVRAGKLRAPAVTTATRFKALPNVPTMRAVFSQGTRRAHGTASARPGTRPPKSSRSSTNTSARLSPSRTRARGSSTWAPSRCR